jgi:hypothetical protein
VFDGLSAAFPKIRKRPACLRRNVIVSGVNLNSLIGEEFELQGVRFLGTAHCRPCYWLDQAFAPGAEAWLKGNGGLRAQILTSGTLRVGAPSWCSHNVSSRFSALLLAGGRSTRMGTDKAFIEIDRVPLWRRQLQLLEELRPDEVLIAGPAHEAWQEINCIIIPDAKPNAGPLAGIVAALQAMLGAAVVGHRHRPTEYDDSLLARAASFVRV